MSVSIIRGTNDKPAASAALASATAGCSDFSGQLFIGYPIVSTPEGRHRIDALLVSPDLGLVVFDLIEGTEPGDYRARQDDSANKLEARLKTHRALMRRRDLRVPIHTLSFAPAVREPDVGADPDYPLAGRATLPHALRRFTWDEPDQSVYEAALSAIENIRPSARAASNARRPGRTREAPGSRSWRVQSPPSTRRREERSSKPWRVCNAFAASRDRGKPSSSR